MEKMRRPQIPSFGDWNQYNELPITQYFDLVRTSQCSQEEEENMFYFSSPVKPTYDRYKQPKNKKVGVEKQFVKSDKLKQRKHVAVRPVDEDLYKIPPELLHQKPKRGFLKSFLTGCFGVSCVA